MAKGYVVDNRKTKKQEIKLLVEEAKETTKQKEKETDKTETK